MPVAGGPQMVCPGKCIRSVLLAACLVSPLMFTGCAARAGYYRPYDPYYRDYHNWNNGEVEYYNRCTANSSFCTDRSLPIFTPTRASNGGSGAGAGAPSAASNSSTFLDRQTNS